MGNIVEFKNVYKSYGKKDVLTDLNVSIPKGKIIGLLGPNGSGKSTLLKCIYRTLKPNGGCIMLGNTPISTMSVKSDKFSKILLLSIITKLFLSSRENLFKWLDES